MSKTTIVMYHYVRDLKNSRYPDIKGLDVADFREQMFYIDKYYHIIRMEELIEAVKNLENLPNNSLLLTFDDAYRDHFECVFPILDDMGVQGSFFPPAKAIQEKQVLDVNKIHFILASTANKKQIISEIFTMMDPVREQYSLKGYEYYYERFATEDRFDTTEVMLIKKMLQRELPEELRGRIVQHLFDKYVSNDESNFSHELYMNLEQLKYLRRKGMYIGSHGYDHFWLNTLSEEEQRREIHLSLEFLKRIGVDTTDFVMSYPYGAYNDSLLALLQDQGCRIAFTTRVGIADLERDHPLSLPRLDTNDLPKKRLAEPNSWTLEILNS